MDPTDNNESEPSKKRVRKSRFDDALPIVDSTIQTTDAAILAATELSKKIMNDKIMQENAIKATAMQSHLASQIASIGTILKTVQNNAQQAKEKRPQYHALRLDSLGREIDEHGNLIKQDVGQIKTLALNNSVVAAKRKKENPYLAHRTPSIPLSVPGLQSIPPSLVAASTFAASASATSAASATASASTSMATMGQLPMQIANSEAIASASETLGQPSKPDEEVIDDRITTTNRDRRKKKALRFVEPGKYVQIADDIQRKEERKIIAGYSSGRKSFQTITSTDQSTDADTIKEEGDDGVDSDNSDDDSDDADADVPPPVDEGVVPSMEWWDEAFLPKTVRDNRKISRAAADVDDSSQLMLQYGKSYKYVQHPVAIKALGTTSLCYLIYDILITQK